MIKITFIGLGNMGLAMAQNLLNAGYNLNIYNRTKEKANELKGNCSVFDSPAEAVADCDFVFTMLAEDESLKEVTLGANGFLNTLKKGAVHVSMSTISPDTSEELFQLHQAKGSHYLAAPVFGRPAAAAD